MNLPLHPLEPGIGFTHRHCLDPVTRRPLLLRFTRRIGDRCSVRIVVCAPGEAAPGAAVPVESCGVTRDWKPLSASLADLRAGLIETRLLETTAAPPVASAAGPPPARARAAAVPERGLTCLHMALRAPHTWEPHTVRVTSVVRGEVNFVGLALWFGREVTFEPYGTRHRSARWSLGLGNFVAGVVRIRDGPDRRDAAP
uniref:Uncharacterized protein n=1 Tax=Eiseniibacteriota bacterium TaxID=2212470 RepID=A0A832MLB5_UNCEI